MNQWEYMKKLLSILVLTTALASCSVSSTSGGTKPGEVKSGIFGLAKADDLKVDTEKAFQGVNDIIVGGFKIGFIESKTDKAQASGGLMGGGFGGRSSAEMSLQGVNDSVKQDITEAAYKDFVANLKAKGYKVANSSELFNDKDFSGTKTYESPYVDDQDGLLTSGAVTKFFQPKEFGKMRFFAGESMNVMGGFAFGNPSAAATTFAEKSGKKVIHVVYIVDFSNAQDNSGITTSAINVGQGISVNPGSSKLGLIGGQGGTFSTVNGSITVGQPIYSTKTFGKVEGTSSDLYKGAEVALNLTTAILGGGTNIRREFVVKAEPAKYKAIATEVVKDTNAAIVGKMAGLK